jgi:molybdate transport system substrate-binding protein
VGAAALTLALAVLLAIGPAAGAGAAARRELTVSLAISMKEAVEALGRTYVARQPGVGVRYNVGASGDLAKQIEAGAPVDVFVSAASAPMDELERRGLIVAATRRAFARNVLAVVVPAGGAVGVTTPSDLLDARVGRIATGNPRTVPAGYYAEQSLRALGLLDRVRPKLVYAENARQVLEWVARGEVDAGWVYTTDVALRAARVREAFRPAEASYPPIVYPAAVVRASREPALAAAFVELLASAEGAATLARFGFLPPPATTR